jgi:polysaccharide deacetylase family protein (PEP-CTERM system associated)
MLNILTIDLEDYFMVSAFEDVVKREDWENHESRIERNTYRLLDILNNPSRNPVRATFFCIGWVAERYPHLIREIRQLGHEIACHSYDHRRIYNTSPDEFREDIRKSRKILEDIVGEEVIGYRAPSYSITNKSRWAFEVLVEEGFRYDSSVFPIHHDLYGMPDAPRFPFIISLDGNSNVEFSVLNFELGTAEPQHSTTAAPLEGITPHSALRTRNYLIEFPISTLKVFGQNLPISGGGYFRLFPYDLMKYGLKRINEKEHKPFVFYLHPWEIDPEQPRVYGLSSRSKFRHYVNLDKTEFKFKKLLSDFRFSTIRQLLIQNSELKTQN